jgi:hypothetical protein
MTEEEKGELRQKIKIAAEEVRSWPAWMQNILVDSARPTVRVPRTPVNNNVATSEKPETCK